MITKLQDWQLRLEAFVAARQTRHFAWGENDCAIFAADAVMALTGVDVALPELRTHKTAKQASRALKQRGGCMGIAIAALGQPAPIWQASIGDVVLAKSAGRELLAICNGQTFLAPGPQGLCAMPMTDALLCWRLA